MFGYVMANKPELKIREFARYKGFYCGLCRRLYQCHGRLGQITLTYDMTFLVILLTSLYEPITEQEKRRCLIHPAKKQFMLYNAVTDYAADMNILLTHDHLRDDWEDERKLKGFLGMKLYARKKRKIEKKYPRQAAVITRSLESLHRLEEQQCADIDLVSRPFGELMSEVFVWKDDSFQNILRPMGFYLGKFIYMMDAWMDREEDAKNHCYNLFSLQKEMDDDRIRGMLDATLRLAIAEFEKLPCEQDVAILRNILYEGVWTTSERKHNDDERSI